MSFKVGSSVDDKVLVQTKKPVTFKVASTTDEVIVIKQCKCTTMPNGAGGLWGFLTHQKYMYERKLINNIPHYRVFKDYNPTIDNNTFNLVHYTIFLKYFKPLNPP